MKNELIKIEKILDEKASKLSIYNLSFQSIYSALLYGAEIIDYKGEKDTAMDYTSRISLIYTLLKKNTKNVEHCSTTEAIIKTGTKEYIEDINFLNAYAHFSMLMPQIYRGTLKVISFENNKIKIDFKNETVKMSELIDKLYTELSLPITFSFIKKNDLKSYIDSKVVNQEFTINGHDFDWIKEMFNFNIKTSINVEVLSNSAIENALGFTNEDFKSFVAALHAFSEYFLTLARSYREQADKNGIADIEKEKLMSEYMEWSVCNLNVNVIGWFITISEIPKNKFDKILSYFIDIHSNNSKNKIKSSSVVGEGFLPPITIIDESILFSPLALRYLLSFNNVLYSLNKIKDDSKKRIFDNELSGDLEPVLINQLEYLFSAFEELKVKKNISYPESEIDLMILSKNENVCLSIQVKTTIAPDSARMVDRVQDRVLEAKRQIDIFECLGAENQLALINKTFESQLTDVKIINLIIVRSSAGSDKGWDVNKRFPILNYSILSKILCKKLNSMNFSFYNFDNEIKLEQEELIQKSNWSVEYERLEIGGYTIEFPNLIYDQTAIVEQSLIKFKCYPRLEKSNH